MHFHLFLNRLVFSECEIACQRFQLIFLKRCFAEERPVIARESDDLIDRPLADPLNEFIITLTPPTGLYILIRTALLMAPNRCRDCCFQAATNI
jgi:hypothetical protein